VNIDEEDSSFTVLQMSSCVFSGVTMLRRMQKCFYLFKRVDVAVLARDDERQGAEG